MNTCPPCVQAGTLLSPSKLRDLKIATTITSGAVKRLIFLILHLPLRGFVQNDKTLLPVFT
jgi:hypothetical protein